MTLSIRRQIPLGFNAIGELLAASEATNRTILTSRLHSASTLLNDATKLYALRATDRFNRRGNFADDFNVFVITRRGHYEVTTHQPMLARLLDPEGLHEQGGLFLECFLRLINSKTAREAEKLKGDIFWKVDPNNKDRIDVRLRHDQAHVVIEMKWNHVDVVGQLEGYWAEEKTRAGEKPVIAVYLTQHGGEPPGVSRALRPVLACISYGELADIFRSTIQEIRSPRVSDIITQYLEVLEGV
jgi:hypothetical protein